MNEQIGSTIDDARPPVADKLHDAAESVRQKAQRLPGGEKIADTVQGAAGKLEASANYLQSHDSREMLQDLWGFIKRHPAQSLIVAGVLGFFVARGLRSD